MKPIHDYFYRFPNEYLRMPGRCRVRIYERENGTHVVVLTELDNNFGESVTSACDRIATNLAATRGQNPDTTRWIQHEPAHDDLPQIFDELQFTWDGNHTASDPQWQRLATSKSKR